MWWPGRRRTSLAALVSPRQFHTASACFVALVCLFFLSSLTVACWCRCVGACWWIAISGQTASGQRSTIFWLCGRFYSNVLQQFQFSRRRGELGGRSDVGRVCAASNIQLRAKVFVRGRARWPIWCPGEHVQRMSLRFSTTGAWARSHRGINDVTTDPKNTTTINIAIVLHLVTFAGRSLAFMLF